MKVRRVEEGEGLLGEGGGMEAQADVEAGVAVEEILEGLPEGFAWDDWDRWIMDADLEGGEGGAEGSGFVTHIFREALSPYQKHINNYIKAITSYQQIRPTIHLRQRMYPLPLIPLHVLAVNPNIPTNPTAIQAINTPKLTPR